MPCDEERLGPEERHAATIWLVAALHRALLRLCQIPIRLRTLSETCQHPCQWAPFGESARDVDLALTLALTETLALRDLIRPTGSQPQLTPVLLASPSMQGARS